MRDAMTVAASADDDARENRDHRKDAGRQRQEQPETEEAADEQPETAAAEELRNPPRFVGSRGRGRAGGCGHRLCRVRELQRQPLLLRWIADAGLGATLRCDFQRQRQGSRTVALDGQTNADRVVVDLDLAEGLVAFLLARRQQRRAELHRRRFGRETELVTVQIVALGDLETHLDALPVNGVHCRPESDCRVEKLFAVHQGGQQQEDGE